MSYFYIVIVAKIIREVEGEGEGEEERERARERERDRSIIEVTAMME